MKKPIPIPAVRLLIVLAASIFIAEFCVMVVLSVLPAIPLWQGALLDSALLIVVISPILYFSIFRPMVLQMEATEKARAELEEETEKATKYFESAGVLLLVLDADGRVRRVNHRGAEILGLPTEGITGKDWVHSFVPERERLETKGRFSLAFAGGDGRAGHFEGAVLTAPGVEKVIDWHLSALRDERGETNAILCSGEDITLQQRAEEALRNAHGELERRVRERTAELELEFAEHRRADEAFKRANRALKTLSDFNHSFVHTSNEASLLDETCRIIVETGGYRAAWIALAEARWPLKVVARAGIEGPSLEEIGAALLSDAVAARRINEALRSKRPIIERAAEERAASISVPFVVSDALSGAINIHALEADAFDDDEVGLLRQLAGNLAYGIYSMRIHLERKRANEALMASETKYRSLTQSANDAIVTSDDRGRITGWNKGAQKIFGYTEDEALGNDLTLIMPARFHEPHRAGIERVNKGGDHRVIGKTIEIYGLRKDGAEFPIELSIAAWRTAEGAFYSGIIRDVTDRKRAQEEKENIQAQLLHSQRLEAIGRLIFGVAHDFSNIVLSIKGYAAASMRRVKEDDPLYKNMRQIMDLVDRGSNVTRQLLLFGKKQPAEFVRLDMNETIESLLKMIKNLINSEITVNCKFDPELKPVRANRSNVEQVLLNLVVNASDAMAHGGVLSIITENVAFEPGARDAPRGRSGEYVRVTVTDTGVGMEKAVSERIFDPFFTTKRDGSGLGLSVVYGIINGHNGWIDVESAPRKGTTFKFCLPVYPPEAGSIRDS
jgi:PAS domain S-box-containing protein